MVEPEWLQGVQAEAARLLGLPAPLVFPPVLVDPFSAELVFFAADRIPEGQYSTPLPEFGVLGAEMPAYFTDYEFSEYFPGAWPLALDGGGGFYCLDLRDLVAGVAPNDGSASLVWSHAGNLGWREDEHVVIATDIAEFFATAVTGRA